MRVKEIREAARIRSGRQLSAALGEKHGFISYIETGQARRVDYNVAVAVARECAGKGWLQNYGDIELERYLLTGIDDKGFLDMQASKGYWLHAPSHLGFSPSQTEPGCPGDSIPVRENKFAFAS